MARALLRGRAEVLYTLHLMGRFGRGPLLPMLGAAALLVVFLWESDVRIRFLALAGLGFYGGVLLRDIQEAGCRDYIWRLLGRRVCKCGILENASKEPAHAIRWDEQMNEYYIVHGTGGKMMVYYCPFCGGSTPKSRRASMFAHVTQREEGRILWLIKDIRTVPEVIARFGPPDEETGLTMAVRNPGGDGKPERGEVFRCLVYKQLSPVADIIFEVGAKEAVRGTWSQKYVGDKPAGQSSATMSPR
ncbi:MAG: hypothetical protein WC708_02815 [Lentisphaeria bacterium]